MKTRFHYLLLIFAALCGVGLVVADSFRQSGICRPLDVFETVDILRAQIFASMCGGPRQ